MKSSDPDFAREATAFQGNELMHNLCAAMLAFGTPEDMYQIMCLAREEYGIYVTIQRFEENSRHDASREPGG